MARHKQSPLEDVIEAVSRLPWWVGVGLAVVSYIVLSVYASIQVKPPGDIHNIGSAISRSTFHGLASVGRYVLPLIFLLGALASGARQFRNRMRLRNVQESNKQNPLLDMTWREFEELVGEFFRRRGYSMRHLGGNGPDGGVDLVATRGNDRYFIQCKQWRARKVGVQAVRELYGVMNAEGAAGGFVVTSGQFTDEAKHFAEGLNIRLFDGACLRRMIREVDKGSAPDSKVSRPAVESAPLCPKCGQPLVRRVARKGPHAGKPFWGCSGFPGCRYVASA